MLSIRAKAFLIVTAIVGVISISSTVISLSVARRQMLNTVENDMLLVASLADELISHRIDLLKATAFSSAQNILGTPKEEMIGVLREEVEANDDFMAMTVFDAARNIAASYGAAPAPGGLAESGYGQRGFGGEVVFSTTHLDPSGRLVLYVIAPLQQEGILAVTVPGELFSKLLAPFKIWETGHIFIDDETGTVLSNPRWEWVLGRYNFIERAKTDRGYEDAARVVRRMIRQETGVGRFAISGVERICAFRPVASSLVGWSLGVIAPLSENPGIHIQRLFLIAGAVFFGMGLAAAFFASKAIARPFSRIQEQNLRLEELNEVARHASEAKSRFLANMSHEMRTPLNAIIGLSELTLRDGGLAPAVEENLEKVYSSGATLLGIVNDLLDISKIESGKFELMCAEYDVPSLINDTINLNIIRIGSKPITFKLIIDDDLPSRLYGDELRIKQIFNNLLSNAFKYTKEGAVEWRVSCRIEGETARLETSVKDSGIGIRGDDKEKLFSAYSRLDPKNTRQLEGTGLGLALTKRLVELMGGGITVESEYGAGSVFTARFEQKPVSAPPIGAEAAANLRNFHYSAQKRSRSAALSRVHIPYAKVLVVDDVSINLDVAKGMMMPYGMQVDTALGGREAVEIVRAAKVRYNAIFMDHMMPGIDGIEAVRIIREEIGTEYAKTVPIIVLTANALMGNEEMFLGAGFQDFLTKPIDIFRLDAVIHRWVRDKSRERGSAEDAPSGGNTSDLVSWVIPGLDIPKALERFGGNGEVLAGTLRSYQEQIHGLLDALRTVPGPDDTEALKRYTVTAHGVKGASYGICADEAGRLAEDLEKAARAGDSAYIAAHNGELIAAAEQVAAALAAALGRDAPDPGVLARLKEACRLYDLPEVDRLMGELERYAYRSGQDRVRWLRERIDAMDLQTVAETLS
ncbi:MAG: response regulator [Treponema sp.]|jgi:signal transduction histidine kinase/CheY-like chemotaxis protein|nr:response regulator [Treponema sp.]